MNPTTFNAKTFPLEAINPEIIAKLRGMKLDSMASELQERFDKSQQSLGSLNRFITQDPELLEIKEQTKRLSLVDDSVLITGETGTGKELIAQALHGTKEGKFVAFNCAGLPDGLVESELFGHIKGAFTGASRDKEGLFEVAKNGTLFLDEIGDFSLFAQAKILRAIQEQTIRRVGDDKEIKTTCRIVSATHRDIKDMVENEKFREDLYYRIAAFEIHLKSLWQREAKDILLILDTLDSECRLSEEIRLNIQREILTTEMKGNVRKLQHIVRRYYVLGKI